MNFSKFSSINISQHHTVQGVLNMILLDSQGNPTRPRLSDDDLIKILQSYSMKLESLNVQILQISLLIEYLMDQLLTAAIELNMEGFSTWAEERFNEIRQSALDNIATSEKRDLEAQQAAQEQAIPVNLSDE